jgi:hypothetical protein
MINSKDKITTKPHETPRLGRPSNALPTNRPRGDSSTQDT